MPHVETNWANFKVCIDCNGYDDVTNEDNFMRPFGDEDFICNLCAEERGIDA